MTTEQPKKLRSLKEILEEKKLLQMQHIQAVEDTVPSGQITNPILLDILRKKEENSYENAHPKAFLPDERDYTAEEEHKEHQETFSLNIVLNEKQTLAKELAFSGKSFCLIGAAGTGKTTAQREIARSLLEQGCLSTHDFRVQGTGQHETCPSIAFVAFTRIASANLRRAIHKDPTLEETLRYNVTTVHNLLEYIPETYWDSVEDKEKFRFIPQRNASNPLDITHLVIEEASMIDLDLWGKIYAALRPDTQIIYIGDINQLPPVFGASVLNYALMQLPIVELTHVYRQQEDSMILENAHNILGGKPVVEASDFQIIRGGEIQHSQHKLSMSLGVTFPKWQDAGEYDPLQDIILSPWNKQDLGTDNINNWIAQSLGDKRDAVVHEILCGINKRYLAVGDDIMYNKILGKITAIRHNGDYVGKTPRTASKNLTRFGAYRSAPGTDEGEDDFELAGYENLSIDQMLDDEVAEKKKQASHIVTIELEDGEEIVLNAVGDFAQQVFSLAYCLTVHKAQGCEWRKVFIVLHRDHAVSLFRELLYTAVTRAKEKVVIIAKDSTINQAIKTQRIKGNTLKEKLEFFNGNMTNIGDISCTK